MLSSIHRSSISSKGRNRIYTSADGIRRGERLIPGSKRRRIAIRDAFDGGPGNAVRRHGRGMLERNASPNLKRMRCECDGTGEYVDGTEAHGDEETIICDACNGDGKVAPFSGETYEVDRAQLVRALVGKELAEYV